MKRGSPSKGWRLSRLAATASSLECFVLCFAAGVNRIGVDGNNQIYSGDSQVIDYLGNTIVEPQPSEGIFYADLDKDIMLATRNQLRFLDDMDSFILVMDIK